MTKPPNRESPMAVLIRDCMSAAAVSQNQLAAKLGTTQSQVSKWCNGRSSPRADVLLQIVAICGFKVGPQ